MKDKNRSKKVERTQSLNKNKKRIGLLLLVGLLLLQTLGCQKASQQSGDAQKAKSNQQQVSNEVKDNKDKPVESDTGQNQDQSNQEEQSGTGVIVTIPEGVTVPSGAEDVSGEGLPPRSYFLPQGVEVPEGAKVQFQVSGEDIAEPSSADKKAGLKEAMPQITKDIRKVLIEKAHKIHPDFDMEKMQILLVSNTLRTAYLINSQDEKYGQKDEIVEYATDTIKDNSILTQVFSVIQFNNKPTYIFNVDFFTSTPDTMKADLTKSVVHEAVHLILQKKIDENLVTAEEVLGDRSIKYPVDSQGRRMRAQMAYAYKNALESKDEKQREDWIKKGNYFLKQFMDSDKERAESVGYDRVEGQARYYEYRALAILEGKETEADIIKRAHERYKDSQDYQMPLTELSKDGEHYFIGSLAYALIHELNQQKALGYDNPVKYLLDKYGVAKSEGDAKLDLDIKEKYDMINTTVKSKIDAIDEKIKDEEYVIIKVPVSQKYEVNSNVSYEDDSIQYTFKGKPANIEKVSRELRLGNSRILLKGVSLVTDYQNEDVNHYLLVPKKDVQIDGKLLTVQRNDIQIYDAKFNQDKKTYELTE